MRHLLATATAALLFLLSSRLASYADEPPVNLALVATATTSYVFHWPRPRQRFSIDMLRSPRGLSGTIVTPPTPKSSPCT